MRSETGDSVQDTLSIKANYVRKSSGTTPLFDTCGTIKGTPPAEFGWLVGRIFTKSC